MTNASAPVPPPPTGLATPPQSAAAEVGRPPALVLPASGSAVSSQPQHAAQPSPPIPPTSGTRATPAPTHPPAGEPVSSPSTKSLTISAS